MERTLVILKPDSVQRGICGRIISRFEEKGFKIAAMKIIWMTTGQAAELYKPHYGKSFYDPLVEYMTSGPIVPIVVDGIEIISQVRSLMGATNPQEAEPGSIRGDFGQRVDKNCVHGSDSRESAEREIPIFFKEEEIVDYKHDGQKWI